MAFAALVMVPPLFHEVPTGTVKWELRRNGRTSEGDKGQPGAPGLGVSDQVSHDSCRRTETAQEARVRQSRGRDFHTYRDLG